MRVLLTLALAGHCAAEGRMAGPAQAVTGIHIETTDAESTGEPDLPRLDLGTPEPWSTGESTGGTSSTGPVDLPTTGATSTGGETTGDPAPGTSTGGESTSTGEGSTGPATTSGGTSTGGDTSTGGESTGEPPPECPCEDGADNVCDLAPGTCPPTMPGGYCDPDGDGAFFDGDWTLGWQEYKAACG